MMSISAIGRTGFGPRFACVLAGAAWAAISVGCTIPAETRAKNQRELGVAAYNRGEYPLAKTHFLNSIDAKPTGFRQHYWLGKSELKLGRPVVAQSEFEYAWTVRQNDPEWTPKILNGIAEAMYQQDLRDELYTFLAETASRYGTSADYLRQARYLVKMGDPDNAVVAYRKAVRFARGDDPTPYLAIADFYESVNDIPNAVKSLRYAYYLDPTNQSIAERFRKFGIVPGPTLRLAPPKPEMLEG